MSQIAVVASMAARIPYPTVVREDEDTDGTRVFLAEIPDLPGCMSHGNSPDEAIQGLAEALDLYLETLEENGQPIPQPSTARMTTGTGATGADAVTTFTITRTSSATQE